MSEINSKNYIGTLSKMDSVKSYLIKNSNDEYIQVSQNIQNPNDCLHGANLNSGYCGGKACPYIIFNTDSNLQKNTCYYSDNPEFNKLHLGILESIDENQIQMNENDPIKIYINPQRSDQIGKQRDIEKYQTLVDTYKKYQDEMNIQIIANKILLYQNKYNLTLEEAKKKVYQEQYQENEGDKYTTLLSSSNQQIDNVLQIMGLSLEQKELIQKKMTDYQNELSQKNKIYKSTNEQVSDNVQHITKEIQYLNHLSKSQDKLIQFISKCVYWGIIFVCIAFIYTILRKSEFGKNVAKSASKFSSSIGKTPGVFIP